MDLKRWKSVGTFDFSQKYVDQDQSYLEHRSQSESSLEPCAAVYSESSSPCVLVDNSEYSMMVENGSNSSSMAEERSVEGKLTKMEQKIDKLNKLLQDQLNLMVGLRRELAGSGRGLAADTLSDTNYLQSLDHMIQLLGAGGDGCGVNRRAQSLLDAIELKHLQRIDFQIKDSITKFLLSDDLKVHLAAATVESLKHVVRSCFSETFSRAYLPALENSHRKLLKVVTKILHSAFHELEVNSTAVVNSSQRASRSLRAAIDKHQALLEAAPPRPLLHDLQNVLEEVLQNELKEWRGKLFEVLMSEMSAGAADSDTAAGPPPPAHSSAVNQLMKSAIIKKHIEEGNVNASFEEALSSGDLALVIAACSSVDPALVFGPPCRLRQPVLLSLVQQLVTDMVQNTHLKCRYLEEAIIKLDPTELGTRAHLPLVVHEVRTHLTRFLHAYPGHVAATRITLIIMAADNLIKFDYA